jgi:uncharacterized protein (DUF305 family)
MLRIPAQMLLLSYIIVKRAYLDVKFIGKVKAQSIDIVPFFTESSHNLYLNFMIMWQKEGMFCLNIKIKRENKRISMIYRKTLILMFGLMLLFLAACGGTPTVGSDAATTAEMAGMDHDMSKTAGDEPYDALFIDSMIMHHQGAIEMANQALTEATKPEIKTLAEAIIKAQEAEIGQMQEWRKNWYPDLAPTTGMGMDMGTMEIDSDSGKPFDQRFIEAMIPHHEGAINMAKDAQQNAEYEEIKNLSGEIITAQEAEIGQMRQWLKDWYGQ